MSTRKSLIISYRIFETVEDGLEAEWAEVVRGLDNLQQVELFVQGSRFLLRSQLKGDASQAIRAAEVALPPVLQEIA